MVGELHGTAVAGVIAARADNRVGIAGVAPGARLLALRACVERSAGGHLVQQLGLALALAPRSSAARRSSTSASAGRRTGSCAA